MKFVVKNISGENISNLMRRLGYHFWGEKRETKEMTFTRPIEGIPYPRFHVWLKENKETGEIFLNLHLDQKKPIYKDIPAHSGEHEGGVVEKEAERIKNFLSNL